MYKIDYNNEVDTYSIYTNVNKNILVITIYFLQVCVLIYNCRDR